MVLLFVSILFVCVQKFPSRHLVYDDSTTNGLVNVIVLFLVFIILRWFALWLYILYLGVYIPKAGKFS
jgi:hypothetical protein